MPNLIRHITNAKRFGIPVIVAINSFDTDSAEEIRLIERFALQAGAETACVCTHWMNGGKGAVELARAVVEAAERPKKFEFLYPLDAPIKEKIETIARFYGASGVDYSPEAEAKIERFTRLGYTQMPICMAKTHLSFTADAAIKGAPTDFRIPIRDIRVSVGAGFLYPLVGTMRTMPGLATRSAFMDVDVDLKTGKVMGLF
jgi:formyltetrahydrofolate synthetase